MSSLDSASPFALPQPLEKAAVAAINHLLAQQGWARDILGAHAGRSLQIRIEGPLGPLVFSATLGPEGLLLAHDGDPPAVELNLKLSASALLGWMREGVQGLSRHLTVEGDVMVAAALGQVARQINWDFEEDLSRVLGDVLAHRLGQGVRRGWRQAADWRDRAASGLRLYAVEEAGLLVDRSQWHRLEQAMQGLDGLLSRLEARLPSPLQSRPGGSESQ